MSYQQLLQLKPAAQQQALLELSEAAEAAAFNDSGLCGRLNMLAPMSFGTLWLAPLIAEFMRLHPQLEVSLYLEDRISDFEREGYDLCVRISRIGDSALIARRLSPRRCSTIRHKRFLRRIWDRRSRKFGLKSSGRQR